MSSRIITLGCSLLAITASSAAFAGGRMKEEMQGGVAGATCSCAGDIDGNGAIDASDLGLLLGAWGSVGGDLNGNGTTDAADLAIVLGAWGPCGAPSNDECSDAILIGNGDAVSFCNVNATWSGQNFTAGTCEGSTVGTIGHDVWFQYVPEGDGTVTFSTCGAADFDTVIAVYTSVLPVGGGCPPESGLSLVTLLGCCDDSDLCGTTSTQSKLSLDVTGGKSYMVRVGGYGAATGSGTLDVSFKSIGSQCFDGILIEGEDGVTQTVSGTTVDNFLTYPACVDYGSHGEWITYIPSCQEEHVFLSTCNDGTNFDTVISVWKETLAGGCEGTLQTCEDDTQSTSCLLNGIHRKTKADFYASAGYVYHILVAGYNEAADGDYELTIETDCVSP